MVYRKRSTVSNQMAECIVGRTQQSFFTFVFRSKRFNHTDSIYIAYNLALVWAERRIRRTAFLLTQLK